MTGVRLGIPCVAGKIPLVKNKAGGLRGHQVHSTVTALRTPVYSSAPKRARTAVNVFIDLQKLFSFQN